MNQFGRNGGMNSEQSWQVHPIQEYLCPWCEASHLFPVKPLPPQVVRRALSLESFLLGIGVGALMAAGVLVVVVR